MTRRHFVALVPGALIPASALARPNRGARYRVRRAAAGASGNRGPLDFELASDERWPIRGLDPVLHIGDLAVEGYRYGNAENTVLIFTCYEPDRVQEGASVHVQYGQDTDSRTEFPNFRWADVEGGAHPTAANCGRSGSGSGTPPTR